jgi:hypothetical protein
MCLIQFLDNLILPLVWNLNIPKQTNNPNVNSSSVFLLSLSQQMENIAIEQSFVAFCFNVIHDFVDKLS